MRKEQLKSNLNLKFASGNIDITKLSQERLQELGIADKLTNKIDTNQLRLGSLGAYVAFLNDSKDTISVTSSSIEIESYKLDRLMVIINGLKELFSEVMILSGEMVTNWHLNGDNLPENVLHQHTQTDGYKTDVIQLKKSRNLLMLYQCGRNTVHVRHQIKVAKKTMITNLDLDDTFNFQAEQELLMAFINKLDLNG